MNSLCLARGQKYNGDLPHILHSQISDTKTKQKILSKNYQSIRTNNLIRVRRLSQTSRKAFMKR